MIFLSTGEVPCPHCGGKTTMGLLEIRDAADFTCKHCARSSPMDAARFSHDIVMYELALRQFGGNQDGAG